MSLIKRKAYQGCPRTDLMSFLLNNYFHAVSFYHLLLWKAITQRCLSWLQPPPPVFFTSWLVIYMGRIVESVLVCALFFRLNYTFIWMVQLDHLPSGSLHSEFIYKEKNNHEFGFQFLKCSFHLTCMSFV